MLPNLIQHSITECDVMSSHETFEGNLHSSKLACAAVSLCDRAVHTLVVYSDNTLHASDTSSLSAKSNSVEPSRFLFSNCPSTQPTSTNRDQLHQSTLTTTMPHNSLCGEASTACVGAGFGKRRSDGGRVAYNGTYIAVRTGRRPDISSEG